MNLAVPAQVVRAANSEIRKTTSLRLGRVLATFVLVSGVLAFAAAGITVHPADEDRSEPAGSGLAAVVAVLIATIVTAGVFGAVQGGTEDRHRTLAVTMVFAPDRDVVFGAKMAVAAVFSLLTVLITEVVGSMVFWLFAHGTVGVPGRYPVALASLLGAVVCWALIGTGIGLILRSSRQAVAAVLGWLIVVEPLTWLVATVFGIPGFAAVLPGSATLGTISADMLADSAFIAPTAGAAVVLLLWTAGIGGAAWWDLRHRDI